MATPPLAVLAYEGVAFHAAHIAERYGLFTLIVLGESVVAVGASLADTGFDIRTGATAALGFGIAACVWWIYFGSVRWSALGRASVLRGFVWGYGHLFVYAGIAAMAVGVHLAAEAAHGGETLTLPGRTILAGGVASFLLAVTSVHLVTVLRWDAVATPRVLLAAGVLALGLAGSPLPPAVFVGAVLAGMLVLTVWEVLLGQRRPDAFGPATEAWSGPVA
jgi:low temperature requirement protein LtrA